MTRLAFPVTVDPLGRVASVGFGEDAHVRQMLELLIMTMAGERPMRPTLGSPVRELVFGGLGGPGAAAIEAALQAAIGQWMGAHLTLEALTVTEGEDDASLIIAVTYRTLRSLTPGALTVSVGLVGPSGPQGPA
ncbi:MAG: GPW/gp25 family protein [Rubrimonas sp.]